MSMIERPMEGLAGWLNGNRVQSGHGPDRPRVARSVTRAGHGCRGKGTGHERSGTRRLGRERL